MPKLLKIVRSVEIKERPGPMRAGRRLPEYQYLATWGHQTIASPWQADPPTSEKLDAFAFDAFHEFRRLSEGKALQKFYLL